MHSASVVLPEPECPSKTIFLTWEVSKLVMARRISLKVRKISLNHIAGLWQIKDGRLSAAGSKAHLTERPRHAQVLDLSAWGQPVGIEIRAQREVLIRPFHVLIRSKTDIFIRIHVRKPIPKYHIINFLAAWDREFFCLFINLSGNLGKTTGRKG